MQETKLKLEKLNPKLTIQSEYALSLISTWSANLLFDLTAKKAIRTNEHYHMSAFTHVKISKLPLPSFFCVISYPSLSSFYS